MSAVRSAQSVEQARRGVLLAEHRVTDGTAELDGGMRLQVLDILIAALEGSYAHLVAKRAAYASNPVQALTLLRRRSGDLSDAEFHRAVSTIMTGLRDAHTRYIGPQPACATRSPCCRSWPSSTALTRPPDIWSARSTPSRPIWPMPTEFVAGVELESWNGMTFARAVEIHADSETGGRPDSRRARACESLTFRALDYGPPPDEDWVIIGYRTRRGRRAEVRLPWRLLRPGKAAIAVAPGSRGAQKQAADPAAEAVRRAKKLMFAPKLWAVDSEPIDPGPGRPPPSDRCWRPRCRTCWPRRR